MSLQPGPGPSGISFLFIHSQTAGLTLRLEVGIVCRLAHSHVQRRSVNRCSPRAVAVLYFAKVAESHGAQPIRLLYPWDFPGENTGVGCHVLLQGIFLTRGLNLGLLHCRRTLYPLSHQGSPILSKIIHKYKNGKQY